MVQNALSNLPVRVGTDGKLYHTRAERSLNDTSQKKKSAKYEDDDADEEEDDADDSSDSDNESPRPANKRSTKQSHTSDGRKRYELRSSSRSQKRRR